MAISLWIAAGCIWRRAFCDCHQEHPKDTNTKEPLPSYGREYLLVRERQRKFEAMPENRHPHSLTRWAQSKSDDDLISEYEFVKASSKLAEDGDHPEAKFSNDFRDLKNEERLEALAEEMELRKLGDYAYISGEGSTHMPPLAAAPIATSGYIRPEGGSIQRPDETIYLRPQENAPSHSGQITSATSSEIIFDPPPGKLGQLPLSELPLKEVLDEDLGPMPDSIRELERYIAEVEMIFNSRDEQLSGPWPVQERKELLERHAEAKSRLENMLKPDDFEVPDDYGEPGYLESQPSRHDEGRATSQAVTAVIPDLYEEDHWRITVRRGRADLAKLQLDLGRPSDAVKSILSAALEEVERVSRANQGVAIILPMHLWFGVLALGRIEQNVQYRSISLPAALYSSWRLNDATYIQIRSQILATTPVNKDTSGIEVRAADEVLSIVQEAKKLRESCSAQDPFLSARHLIASLLFHTLRSPSEKHFLNDWDLHLEKAREFLDVNLLINKESSKEGGWQKVFTDLRESEREVAALPASKHEAKPAPEPQDVERAKVLDLLKNQWSDFFNVSQEIQWSSSIKASLELLQKSHLEVVENAASPPPESNKLAEADVPFGLTPESLFFAMLLYGIRFPTSKGAEEEASGQLPKMLVEAGGWTEPEVLERLKRSFQPPSFDAQTPERFQLATQALADVINKSAHLVEQGSSQAVTTFGDGVGIIGTRHLLIALIHQAQERPKTEGGFRLPIQRQAGKAVDQDDLLIQLMKYLGTHMRAQGDSCDRWNNLFAELGLRLEGQGLSATRFVKDEELGLNVKQTAEAVAEIFQAARPDSKAPSEFIFALYGEWGRGKTTLINKVARNLEKEGYFHIFFSAWKYPTRPEVWVHLYERIRELASEGRYRQRLRISFRLGLLDSGWTPLLLGLVLLHVSVLLPADEKTGLWGLLGYGGALLSGTFILRTTSFGKLLAQRYLKAPDHSDKLGLQAVIGRDLKNLLRVWVESPIKSEPIPDMQESPMCAEESEKRHLSKIDFKRFAHGWWGACAASILCVGIAVTITLKSWNAYSEASNSAQAPPNPNDVTSKANALMDSTYLTAVTTPTTFSGTLFKLKQPAKPPSFPWEVIVATWLTSMEAVIYLGIVTRALRRQKMLLLTVDDLDRCEPAQMLAVVDSLRLFVDDETMSRRMQVAMLMDRNLLEKALINRASESKMSPNPMEERRFCLMQREKLFVCELEMPALDTTDRNNIVDKLLPAPVAFDSSAVIAPLQTQDLAPDGVESSTGPKGNSTPPIQPPRSEVAVTAQGTLMHIHYSTEKNTMKLPLEKPGAEDSSSIQTAQSKAYHDKEIVALRKAIAAAPAHLLTPRSIRMIKIRFELARLLLKKLNVNASPESVAALILRRFAPTKHGVYTGGAEVERIVAHVTCDSSHR